MIRIFPDIESLSSAAAEIFVQESERAIEARSRFNIAFSGGSTPKRAYEMLAQTPFWDRVPWERVHAFWGDERCVPPNDPQNNARMTRRSLLDHVPIPPAQVHPIVCSSSPRLAARMYEKLLADHFDCKLPRFDLIFLGMGKNAHFASLFPNSAALLEKERWVFGVHEPGVDMDRVTLTLPVINNAARVVFLVSGSSKARVLRDVLECPPDPMRLPAQLVRPADENALEWLIDEEAAALLKKGQD